MVPAEGATTKMYFGSHVSRTQFIIWKWDDAGNTVTNATVTHPIYSSTTYSCEGTVTTHDMTTQDLMVTTGVNLWIQDLRQATCQEESLASCGTQEL